MAWSRVWTSCRRCSGEFRSTRSTPRSTVLPTWSWQTSTPVSLRSWWVCVEPRFRAERKDGPSPKATQRIGNRGETFEQAQAPPTDQLLEILEVINMTVHLSRIYTRTGDGGETHLGDRSRVRKTDPRIQAYGDVDELSSHIGVAIAIGELPDEYVGWLRRIQNDLYDIGADLAVPFNDAQGKARLRIHSEYVLWLEQVCDEVNSPLKPLSSF